ncbi:MAG: GIY-YIG nuclease family protein [Flavobacteriaceae bacterium]
MNYCVYILYSESTERFYTGQTQDIDKRLARHNLGQVKSTKGGKPWELVLVIKVKTRSEALKLESKIKRRGAERFLNDNQFGV